MICQCEDFGIFIYSFLMEMVQVYIIMITIDYYSAEYVSIGFYQKKKLEVLSIIINVLSGIFLYFGLYPKRNQEILTQIRMYNCIIITAACYLYILIMAFINNDINKAFFKRFFTALTFKIMIFFHIFIFKGIVQFIILDWFQNNTNSQSEAINQYKIFLLFYNMLYVSLGNHVLFKIFKSLVVDNKVSINMIIFLLKFLYTGVFSVKTFNILTSSLSEGYAWISFSIYIYSLVCIYTNFNPFKSLLKKIFYCKRFQKPTSIEKIGFNDLKAGTILEANIVIVLRIFTFKLLPYFFLMTKEVQFYEDCSKKGTNTVEFENLNLIVLSCTQIAIVLGIFMIIVRKKILFNLQVEETNIVWRLQLFFVIYAYVDSNLQNYNAFNITLN